MLEAFELGARSEFKLIVNAVSQLYLQASELEARGTHVMSCDEMTGIQALERDLVHSTPQGEQ